MSSLRRDGSLANGARGGNVNGNVPNGSALNGGVHGTSSGPAPSFSLPSLERVPPVRAAPRPTPPNSLQLKNGNVAGSYASTGSTGEAWGHGARRGLVSLNWGDAWTWTRNMPSCRLATGVNNQAD